MASPSSLAPKPAPPPLPPKPTTVISLSPNSEVIISGNETQKENPTEDSSSNIVEDKSRPAVPKRPAQMDQLATAARHRATMRLANIENLAEAIGLASSEPLSPSDSSSPESSRSRAAGSNPVASSPLASSDPMESTSIAIPIATPFSANSLSSSASSPPSAATTPAAGSLLSRIKEKRKKKKKEKEDAEREPVIGMPQDVKHEVHVGINLKTGKFEQHGLPASWSTTTTKHMSSSNSPSILSSSLGTDSSTPLASPSLQNSSTGMEVASPRSLTSPHGSSVRQPSLSAPSRPQLTTSSTAQSSQSVLEIIATKKPPPMSPRGSADRPGSSPSEATTPQSNPTVSHGTTSSPAATAPNAPLTRIYTEPQVGSGSKTPASPTSPRVAPEPPQPRPRGSSLSGRPLPLPPTTAAIPTTSSASSQETFSPSSSSPNNAGSSISDLGRPLPPKIPPKPKIGTGGSLSQLTTQSRMGLSLSEETFSSSASSASSSSTTTAPQLPPKPSSRATVLHNSLDSLITNTTTESSSATSFSLHMTSASHSVGSTSPAPSSPVLSPGRAHRATLDPTFARAMLSVMKETESSNASRKSVRAHVLSAPTSIADDAWLDEYVSVPRTARKFTPIPDPSVSTLLVVRPSEYAVELGSSDANTFGPTLFEDEEKLMGFYRAHIAELEHSHYVSSGSEQTGPVIISVERNGIRRRRVIVRTKKSDERILIPPTTKKNLKYLQSVYTDFSDLRFTKIDGLDLREQLLEFEDKCLASKKYKFGVLYVKANQTEENQWYNNVEHSLEFEEFLSCLGKKVDLANWSNFAGGLDTKAATLTGKHSYYTKFTDYEVMFHVSTMLPFYPNDEQQVERKRHLGNDIVLIVFRDAECAQPFDPLIIKSQFHHVFAVVQPEKSNVGAQATRYKVSFANKIGVPYYGPEFPLGSFLRNSAFREWFLCKLINGERAAMYAPDFKGKGTRTRLALMNSLMEQLAQPDGILHKMQRNLLLSRDE